MERKIDNIDLGDDIDLDPGKEISDTEVIKLIEKTQSRSRMYYGFDTSDENAAVGALLVYGTYRSRDVKRFKVTPDMWGMIERAVKSSSKRAENLADFIEKIKPKLCCSSLKPRYMQTGDDLVKMYRMPTGEIIEIQEQGKKEYWTKILEGIDNVIVLDRLYMRTSLIIALVRDRLERERPLEAMFEQKCETED